MTPGSEVTLASLDGVDALVTGSSRGLGYGIAKVLAADGARVWMVAEVQAELEEAAEGIRERGGLVEVRVVDLADPGQCSSLTQELADSAPRLRVVVNNAGLLEHSAWSDLDVEHWQRTLAVNLTAPVLLTGDLLPSLLDEGGSVINISSRAGVLAFARQSAYCASKFGIEAFTRCLALELAGTRVSVNSLTPGLFLKPTSLTRSQARAAAPQEQARWHDPVELGPAFRFLAGLRGQVSGCRFDAMRLTTSLMESGPSGTLAALADVADYVPPEHEAFPA